MIIFGWRSLTSILPTGTFGCPVCKSIQTQGESRSRTWFTLFFIPLIPVGSVRTSLVCGGCGSVMNPLHAPSLAASSEGVPPVVQHAGDARQTPAPSPMRNSFPSISTWAIVSLITGLLSPLLIIACLLSLVTSTVSVVTGHIAIYSIRNGAGRLKGLGLAIAGLCLGYLSLMLTVAVIVFLVTRPTPINDRNSASIATGTLATTAEGRLREAELGVLSYSNGQVGMGNSPTAESIASEFAAAMKKLDDELFTSSRERIIELTRGEFLTHCELHPNSCALIVHVPSYRDYNDEAREALAELAWVTAVSESSTELEPGDQLAVALRGTLRYGDIRLGTIPSGTESAGAVSGWRAGKSKDLLAFFKEPSTADTHASPVEPSTPTESDSFNTPPSSSLAGESAEAAELRPDVASPLTPDEALASALPPPLFNPESGNLSPFGPTPFGPLPSGPSRPAPERRESDSNRRSKPPAPAFENKIPTELAVEIAADGWNVTSMSFLNHNRWLAVGRLDSTLAIFDAVNGKKLFQSERLDVLGQIVATAESNDQKLLIAGGSSGATATFSLHDSGRLGSPTTMYKHSREAKCIVASPRHSFMISGGSDGTLAWHPYNYRSDSLRVLQKLTKQVQCAFLPELGVEAVATDGYQLLRFSLRDGSVISSHELVKRHSQAAAFHPSGTELAISYGSHIDEFDTFTGELRRSYSASGSETQWSVAYHPTQPWLLSGARGMVIVWDRLSGEQLARLDLDTPLYVQTLAMSEDGSHVATVPAAAGQAIKIFKLTE